MTTIIDHADARIQLEEVAIENDQGGWSRRWRILKRIYNVLPRFARMPYALAVMGPRELKLLAIFILKGRPWGYFSNILNYSERSLRGMSYWHDLIDRIGGYPFVNREQSSTPVWFRTWLNDKLAIKIGHPFPPHGRLVRLFLRYP